MSLRILGFTDNPAHLTDLAGFAKAVNAAETVVVVAGDKTAVEKNSYKLFAKIYYLGQNVQTDQIVEVLSKIYDDVKPDILVGPATKNGNEIAARVAARKDLPMFTEATSVEQKDGELLITRQVMGGRSTAHIKSTKPVALTIPLKKWTFEGETGASIEELSPPEPKYKVVEVKEKQREAVNIEEAEIVVGVGRGFKKKEDLKLAEELANLLGGVVGCTRPIAADYGWLSEDRWIGISGKKIRPKLYIAIGISGAPQHMAAAMDSKIIVAVNKDKNAPIFQYADYGVVADLYQFIPVLIQKLKEKLGK